MAIMKYADWEQLGNSLFGDDRLSWRFVCPSCGHVQKAEDFRPYKDRGASPETVYFACIGRWDGHGHVPMWTKPGPCNYTSGGLFNINPVSVEISPGKIARAFDFDRSVPAPSEKAGTA